MKPKTPLSLTSAAYPGVTPKLVGLGDTAGEGCHFNPIFISHLHKNFQALPALSTHLSNASCCASECGLLLAQERWLWVLMGHLVLGGISGSKQLLALKTRQQGEPSVTCLAPGGFVHCCGGVSLHGANLQPALAQGALLPSQCWAWGDGGVSPHFPRWQHVSSEKWQLSLELLLRWRVGEGSGRQREGCREGGEGEWWELLGNSKASREEININPTEELCPCRASPNAPLCTWLSQWHFPRERDPHLWGTEVPALLTPKPKPTRISASAATPWRESGMQLGRASHLLTAASGQQIPISFTHWRIGSKLLQPNHSKHNAISFSFDYIRLGSAG